MRPSAGSMVTPKGSLPTGNVRSMEAASAAPGSAALRSNAKPKAAPSCRMWTAITGCGQFPVSSNELASRLVRMAAPVWLRKVVLVHNALQPARSRSAVGVDVADHAVRGAKREVIARGPALPPLGLDAPAAHDLDDGEAPTRDLQQRELPFVPHEACRDQVGEETCHEMTSFHSAARSGRRASASATRARSTRPVPSFSRR